MDTKFAAELPGGPPPRTRRARWPIALAGLALGAFVISSGRRVASDTAVCPQESPLVPEKNGALWTELTALHATDEFLMRAVGQLSAAVQIPTETFDAMGPVGEDERWVSRGSFVEHLATAFPLVHATLELQKVNTYGLIYTWQGSDASLKPLMLMGHYDVVPVAPLSADQWTHPAYSGHFDGTFVWGRGSSDDKSGVIGILTSIEVLLEKKFAPTRTVVLSFGFDEEAGGYHGAGHLGPVLLERFGPDSFAIIVDEGAGYSENYGAIFAAPGIAEKGSVNVNVEVQTPGGHSSVPPEHTSIGMLAAMIVHLERNAPKAVLEVGTPAFQMAQCIGAHGPAMQPALKRAILHAGKSKKALQKAEALLLQDPMYKAMVGTTLAVDIVSGGVKSNALPEQALAVVNHRIATQSSVKATTSRDAELLMDLAAQFNLSVTAYGELLTAVGASAYGTLELSAPQTLEPAPITPSDTPAFRLLAGTIRTAFQTARKDAQETIFVTPGMMTGNTDTRFNWALSQHIFRYGHGNMISGGLGGIHTVNEHILAASFVEMITFFTTLILNVDESAL
ncbi:carboxypeptidase S [Mycena rosella]|uniref:Carboxypeptidase S n=1 Tax=Mycena rosella TaxID=1033263 RepID=A0AAD7CYX4_MYCRO|nr:carboxypeptidase S [Mycena rosella]